MRFSIGWSSLPDLWCTFSGALTFRAMIWLVRTTEPCKYSHLGKWCCTRGLPSHSTTTLEGWVAYMYILPTLSIFNLAYCLYRDVFDCVHDILPWFVNSIGAALNVEAQEFSEVLSKLLYNPLCFLQYEDPRVPPDDWQDVSANCIY